MTSGPTRNPTGVRREWRFPGRPGRPGVRVVAMHDRILCACTPTEDRPCVHTEHAARMLLEPCRVGMEAILHAVLEAGGLLTDADAARYGRAVRLIAEQAIQEDDRRIRQGLMTVDAHADTRSAAEVQAAAFADEQESWDLYRDHGPKTGMRQWEAAIQAWEAAATSPATSYTRAARLHGIDMTPPPEETPA